MDAQTRYQAVPDQLPTRTREIGAVPGDPVHWLLPIGRSWQSITAGYVALFAIFMWPLGALSLALGVWALVQARRRNGHGRGRAVFAIVVGLPTTLLTLAVLATL